jgi:hypothetical protein
MVLENKIYPKENSLEYLEYAIRKNNCIDVAFVMRMFGLNRKEFEEYYSKAENNIKEELKKI